ncbi:unnamed protein product [Schistosoma curassoni]|uniref:Protein kinase domain-containing protein n=1 Tax=Schistosoma curassoni TaxID=6186 RepID=A0A183KH11_9TREM|nr:unnamed protein product [Schistosoma curassoni]
MRCLESAEVTYYHGNDLRPSTGIVLKNVGKSTVRILDMDDLSTHDRHVDQIQFQEPDNADNLFNTLYDRHRMNLRKRSTTDYRHLDSNLGCGGYGV